ncbi:MAG: CpaF family protein [Phycisphaerales bacterium]|nr:CpaF family protein [Phycisphaerales bacterium]
MSLFAPIARACGWSIALLQIPAAAIVEPLMNVRREILFMRNPLMTGVANKNIFTVLNGLGKGVLSSPKASCLTIERPGRTIACDSNHKLIEVIMFYDFPAIKPIRHLLMDPQITEIMINGHDQIYVERNGKMVLDDCKFEDDAQVRGLVDRMVEPTGRSITTAAPFVDFRLPDGSRVNVIVPPVAVGGPTVTIRKFTRTLTTISDLIERGTLSQRMADLLSASVKARLNIIFSGATGTGKTTTLGILSKSIPESERIVTIEDTAELDLQQQHVVSLESRPPNSEGKGEIVLSQLVKNALRMRPTRIIMGEIRGDEALDMLQAIATGHDGCLSVMHSSSPRDAVSRLEMMALSRGLMLPLWAIHRQISAAIDLIVQHEIFLDGVRRITHITQVCGLEGDQIALRNIFEYKRTGQGAAGRQAGQWICSGVDDDFLPKFDKLGMAVPAAVFNVGPEPA